MPKSSKSLRRAAWAGLQDSMPRAALLSLHARVEGVEPSTWEDPSLAQLWGPRYSTYVVPKRDFALFSLGRLPDSAKGRERAERMAELMHAHLDGSRGTDREVGQRARHLERVQVRRDDGHGCDPLGGRASADRLDGPRRRRSTRPMRAASSLDATSTSSGRPLLTGSPAGQGSRGARRPMHSPRSKDRFCRSDRRSATSGCSQTTSRPCAPPRRPLRPRACCRAATPTSCSTGRSGSFSFRGRISGERLWTSRVWPGALLVEGEIRGTWRRAQHTVRIDAWARLSRREARRDRGRGPRPAAARPRPGHRGRLVELKGG